MRIPRLSAVALTVAALIAVVTSAPLGAQSTAPHAFKVEVSGRGRPMILIPGLASSGDTWKTTVARYQDRFQCHVLTLAGFAGVPAIDTPMLAAARVEIAAYIRDRHLDHPIIIGHSLGGTLALAIAADHPDLVGPLVIVDSLPFLAGAQFQAGTLEDAKPGIAAMHTYMASQTRAQFDAYVRSGVATKFMATSQADLDRIMQWSLDTDQRTMADSMADLMGLDLREDVARIVSPTLVLGTWAGLHEQIKSYGTDIPREAFVQTFEQQFTKLSRLHFAMAERARHFIMFDDPEWFFAQLDSFLANPDQVVRTRGFGGATLQAFTR
jgi:pimeloyl-ACP methyl ester carboxylesterase